MIARRQVVLGYVALLILGVIVFLWGLYLVAVGFDVPIFAEGDVVPGATRRITDWRGWIPICSGAVVIAGVIFRSLWVCWLGVVVTGLFAVVLLFSVGGPLIPVVAALVFVLAWLHIQTVGISPARSVDG